MRGDVCGRGVDKNADGFHLFWELRPNFQGVRFRDEAGTLLIEIESQEICACVDGSRGVGCVGDTADLDTDHGPYSFFGSTPRRAARAAAGSGESMMCVPTRKASKTAARSLVKCSWACRPDALTESQCSGIRSISSNEVSMRTVSVLRS